jgi:hypothetical protein
MRKIVEFKDLKNKDEFILDPTTLNDDEDLLVFMKYGATNDKGEEVDIGCSIDHAGTHRVFFEPHQKVMVVFGRKTGKMKV